MTGKTGKTHARAWHEGSIYKELDPETGKVVRYRAELVVGKTPDGKPIRWRTSDKRRSVVAARLAQAIADLAAGTLILPDRQTVGTFLEHWLETAAKPQVRPLTYRGYEATVRNHLVPGVGDHQLQKLSAQHLLAFYSERLQAGLSTGTVLNLHRLLHRALQDAFRWELLGRNVCDVVKPPRVTRSARVTLTAAQSRTFLAACETDDDGPLWILAMTTGLRSGELLALKWGDVDLGRGVLLVSRGLARVKGGGWREQETKSAQSRRAVPLIPQAVDALKRQRERQAELREQEWGTWEDHDYIFTGRQGRPLHSQDLWRRSFLPLLEKAGLPRIRPHDLRHGVATLLLELGVHPKIVAEILGHSQISLTLDTYSHVSTAMTGDAMAKLGELLASESTGDARAFPAYPPLAVPPNEASA